MVTFIFTYSYNLKNALLGELNVFVCLLRYSPYKQADGINCRIFFLINLPCCLFYHQLTLTVSQTGYVIVDRLTLKLNTLIYNTMATNSTEWLFLDSH